MNAQCEAELALLNHRPHTNLGYKPRTVQETFWKYAFPEPNSGFWLWSGGMSGNGYGVIRVGSRMNGDGRNVLAHRMSLLIHGRSLEADMDVDHICCNRACVNPDHLEIVTHAENIRRGYRKNSQFKSANTCPHGHELTAENSMINPRDGNVRCKTCNRIQKEKYKTSRAQVRG